MIDLLIEGDYIKCRLFWAEKMPDFPQPASDEEAEIVMHQARTASDIPLELRLWSHRWLIEHSYQSALPGLLIPKSEQLEVVEAKAIGIAVIAIGGKRSQAEANAIRKKMEERAADIMSGKPYMTVEQIRQAIGEVYTSSGET